MKVATEASETYVDCLSGRDWEPKLLDLQVQPSEYFTVSQVTW